MDAPEIIDIYIPPTPPPHIIVPFPLYITVHLGAPDEEAMNVKVPYIEYIKNVASSELYPTWPEEALKANIHAITSIAMNRIFTEWYRSRGYDFDITSSTQYDQAYVHDRGIFDSISNIVNEIFDQYIVREGHIEPLFAAFCDGRVSLCEGMYQWGSVDLANQGYTALEILRYYYGDDVSIVESPVAAEEISGTYPGEPLRLGDGGINVFRMQHSLNRISDNFPLIPKVGITGFFDLDTQNAVKVFQEVFELPITGIVDEETWYRIRYIYVAVTNLAQLISEGLTLEELERIYEGIALEGGTFPLVPYIQFFLNVLSQKYPSIKPMEITDFYGPETTRAIIEFQNLMGIQPTGITDRETLTALYREAYSILISTPVEELRLPPLPFTGVELSAGMGAEYPRVLILEIMLDLISIFVPEIPTVEVGNDFGPDTTASVMAFQRLYGLPVTGIVDEETWNRLTSVYQEFISQL